MMDIKKIAKDIVESYVKTAQSYDEWNIYIGDLGRNGIVEVGRLTIRGDDGEVVILAAYKEWDSNPVSGSITINVITNDGNDSGNMLFNIYSTARNFKMDKLDATYTTEEISEMLEKKLKSYKFI